MSSSHLVGLRFLLVHNSLLLHQQQLKVQLTDLFLHRLQAALLCLQFTEFPLHRSHLFLALLQLFFQLRILTINHLYQLICILILSRL